MIPDRKKLWFIIALKCFKTCDKELSRRHAEMVVNNIKSEEEYKFVKEILGLK